MKRMALLVILAIFGILQNGALAQETNQRIAVSPAFATAQEAVDFANSLPRGSEVKFTCEYRSGIPTESFFKVIYDTETAHELFEWNYREFASPKEAVDFVNDNGSLPSYTTCWNPTRNPAGTSIIVFYNQEWEQIENEVYGPFASAKLAASWANKNECDPLLTEFVSETNAATQTEPIWYVITHKNLDCETKSNYGNWHVRAITKDTESAVELTNNEPRVEGQEKFTVILGLEFFRLAPAFNTWDITGRIVLFVLEPMASEPIKNDDQEKAIEPQEETPKEKDAGNIVQNKPELILPVRIFATKTLLKKSTSECLRKITNTAVNSFHEQINFVRLETTNEIQEAPQIASSDPVILGNSLPYVPNTLAIFFTDQMLIEGNRTISGRAGRSWVVVNVNVCDGCEIKPESVLLHEILHEFGVPHQQNPNSVMCEGLIIKPCPNNVMTIDPYSLSLLRGSVELIKGGNKLSKEGVKFVKGIGFDTYTGLATRF